MVYSPREKGTRMTRWTVLVQSSDTDDLSLHGVFATKDTAQAVAERFNATNDPDNPSAYAWPRRIDRGSVKSIRALWA